jgi:YD repeat-containing protein
MEKTGLSYSLELFAINKENAMEMTRISSGKLRAIGYDARDRILQVQLEDGTTLQYNGIGNDLWRRLRDSTSAWSFYRDNIEEDFASQRVSGRPPSSGPRKNPLDELFG